MPRARFMGGCSATNACFAQRGAAQDYDGWVALGIPGWTFADVLEDFRRLESDADFSGEWHGSDGPIPVRRHPRSELNAIQEAFIDGATAAGHAYAEDHNQPGAVGVGPSPRTARDGIRMSTAMTYLAQARGRANLSIRPETRLPPSSARVPALRESGWATEPLSKRTEWCSPLGPMPVLPFSLVRALALLANCRGWAFDRSSNSPE